MTKEEYLIAWKVLKIFQKENPWIESFNFMYYTQWLAWKMTFWDDENINNLLEQWKN